MAVFLIIVIFIGGLPIFDFLVFQDMKECLQAKAEVEQVVKEKGYNKPLYLECKSDPGRTQAATK